MSLSASSSLLIYQDKSTYSTIQIQHHKFKKSNSDLSDTASKFHKQSLFVPQGYNLNLFIFKHLFFYKSIGNLYFIGYTIFKTIIFINICLLFRFLYTYCCFFSYLHHVSIE